MNATDALLANLRSDAPVHQVLVGALWTAVALETEPPRCGLSSTLRPPPHPGGAPVAEAGALVDRTGRELAELLRSPNTLEASIGMAALNALLEVDESRCTELNAREVILERGAGVRVAIIGHFPFVEQVRRTASACWILELDPRPGDLPAEQAAHVLPQADLVALTGTSLINHTFDRLISLCRPDAYIIMLGGSTPLASVLFDWGVDALSGTHVVDVPAVLGAVSQGASFRQIPGKRLLTMMRSPDRKEDSQR